MAAVIGVDFGTTNSVLTALLPDGSARTLRLSGVGGEVFRSVLCFWALEQGGRSTLRHAAGPEAVQAYLDDPLDSRLILSLKTYLAQRSFRQTRILGRPFALEQLVGLFLRALLGSADAETLRDAVLVAGRPVRFAGETAEDALGESRLRAGFAEAGHPRIEVAMEPEAAGYRFARTLDAPATVLVGDFGGGTSDFSVLRFEPRSERPVTALATTGVGVAGDSFDARIMERVVAPHLGRGGTYRVLDTDLPVPPEWYAGFSRWHRLSMMRNPRTLREIEEVARTAAHPERLRSLARLIEDERGWELYQAVTATKAALSHAERAPLAFHHEGLAIDAVVERSEFEAWIAPELARIEAAVTAALDGAGLGPEAIDRVFLTGGTSFVPAVRRLFEQRFGSSAGVSRISGGGEFVSVAEGLALIGRDRASRV